MMFMEDDIREMVAASKSRAKVKPSSSAVPTMWDTVPASDNKVADVIGHLGSNPTKKKTPSSSSNKKRQHKSSNRHTGSNEKEDSEQKSKARRRDGENEDRRGRKKESSSSKKSSSKKTSSSKDENKYHQSSSHQKSDQPKPKKRLEGRRTKTVPVVAPDAIMVDHNHDDIVSLVSIPKAIRDSSKAVDDDKKKKTSKKDKKYSKKSKKLPPAPPKGLYDKKQNHRRSKDIKEGKIPHVKTANTSLLGDDESESSKEEELFSTPLGLAPDEDSDDSTFVDPDFLPKDYASSDLKKSKNGAVSELLSVDELERARKSKRRPPPHGGRDGSSNKTKDLLHEERKKTKATIELPRKPYHKKEVDFFKRSAVEEISSSDYMPPPDPSPSKTKSSSRKKKPTVQDIDKKIEKVQAAIERQEIEESEKRMYSPSYLTPVVDDLDYEYEGDDIEEEDLAGESNSEEPSSSSASENDATGIANDRSVKVSLDESYREEESKKEIDLDQPQDWDSESEENGDNDAPKVEPHIAAIMKSLEDEGEDAEDEDWGEYQTADSDDDFKLPDPDEILTPTPQIGQQRTVIPSNVNSIDSTLLLAGPDEEVEQAPTSKAEVLQSQPKSPKTASDAKKGERAGKRSWWRRLWKKESSNSKLQIEKKGGLDLDMIEEKNHELDGINVATTPEAQDRKGKGEDSEAHDLEMVPGSTDLSSQDKSIAIEESNAADCLETESSDKLGGDIPDDEEAQITASAADDGVISEPNESPSSVEKEAKDAVDDLVGTTEEDKISLQNVDSSSAKKASSDSSDGESGASESGDSLGADDEEKAESLGEMDEPEDIEIGKAETEEAINDQIMYKETTVKRGMMCNCRKLLCALLCCGAIAGVAIAVYLFLPSNETNDKDFSPGYIGDDDFFYDEEIVVSPGVVTTAMSELKYTCIFATGEEFPNINDQCRCTNPQVFVPQDVAEMREKLISAISSIFYDEQPYLEPVTSCEPSNQALVWLASGDNRDRGDVRQRYALASK
jgi:hypothetical protein